ncbi:hypothetical protein KFK09_026783 [Dendrobium nobile]|uniref:Transposase Tnp1/En/Spm-like domain-containing protein n=1 Tax=Dendrobium nobile TaxID=94219 RepID=A0A8T3A8H9_DENNO|nr:hypothetical protein KFK09_026783 [Dendrobium nobile]
MFGFSNQLGRNGEIGKQTLNLDIMIEKCLLNYNYVMCQKEFKDQWKNLLTYWNSEESKCISERNKKSRSKKSLMHITGKKSFGQVREDQEKSIGHSPTRVEMFERCYTKEGITNSIEACEALEKMKEIRSQTSQTEDVGRDDIFSKVLGNDKVGRVRMYGFGVTPYVAWGEIPNRSSAYQLIEGYKEAFEKMEKQVQEQGEVGTKVAVKSILDSTKTVAIGYIQSMDPEHKVGNYPLGPNWCAVHINIPVNWEEHLIRPYSTLTAIGTYVAWPQALVRSACVGEPKIEQLSIRIPVIIPRSPFFYSAVSLLQILFVTLRRVQRAY